MVKLLFVDDDSSLCEVAAAGLTRRGFEVVWRTSGEEAEQLISSESFDVVATDLNMGGMDGNELCRRILERRPDLPVVVLTAFGSMESAVGAIRAGAYDFIVKPVELETLSLTLERAAKHSALTREVRHLRQVVDATTNLHDVYGKSGPMQDLFDLVNHVADTEATVLVTGESGTGKELIARALHRGSRRKDGPFIAINCGAIPESLLEAELFGHARGAFTDAKDGRRGLLLAADGGTLLLDEIGEMPLGMQVKLLRALQERTVRPLGSTQEQPFDTRLIAATQRDLEQEARDGRFREDLYYRVNVVHIHVPPLRARGADILLLAQHFLERAAKLGGRRIDGLSPEAAERLMTYHWPGNVRELQNAMERAAALTRTPEIGAQDLPDRIRHYRAPAAMATDVSSVELLTMDEVERRHILAVLHAMGGNKTQAAEILGFDRKTLYRKLERYGVAEP